MVIYFKIHGPNRKQCCFPCAQFKQSSTKTQLFKICWAMEISGACKIDHLITGKQYGLQMLTGHCYNKKGEGVVPCLLIYFSSGPWRALSNLSPLKTCFPEPLYLYPQTQPPPTFKLISPPIYHGVAIPFCDLPQPNALRTLECFATLGTN